MKKINLIIGIAIMAAMLMTACKNEVTGIKLGETMLIIQLGEQHHLTAAVEPKKADQSVLWISSDINIVSVDNNGILSALSAGAATITAIAGDKTATCKVYVSVKINGVVWAPYNVDNFGTLAETPESAGKFYQWNRPKAWETTGNVTGWDNTDITGIWETANDPCPEGWRLPVFEELLSLKDAGSVWTKNGRLFGTAPNQIFLPDVGFRYPDGSLSQICGFYWSSTEFTNNTASVLGIDSDNATPTMGILKSHGLSVRCVKN